MRTAFTKGLHMTTRNTLFATLALILTLCAGCSQLPQGPGQQASLRTRPVISGNVGLSNVNMTGFPNSVSSDQDGHYQVNVNREWSGTVTPVKEGYAFSPASRQYSRIGEDHRNQHYQAKKHRYIISGSVGAEGVFLKGLPGNVITDGDGCYDVRVDYGWSGVVTPTKEGLIFRPAKKHYAKVRETQIHEDYQSTPAPPRTVDIEGRILANGAGVAGVQVRASNNPQAILTDEQGRYTLTVPYGWSGQLTPHKPGFKFEPPHLAFEDLRNNIDLPDNILVQSPPAQDTPGAETQTVKKEEPERPQDDPVNLWPELVYVQDTALPAAQALELEQDLLTMCLILTEAVHGPQLVEPLLSQDLKVIRIQGYGVAFLLKVDYPLASQAEASEMDTDGRPDDVWAQARRRLLSAKYVAHVVNKLNSAKTVQLQEKLTGVLKHAANIRHLAPQDQIIVCISGVPGDATRPAHMTLRTEMGQISRLFKGELDSDAFAAHVTVSVN